MEHGSFLPARATPTTKNVIIFTIVLSFLIINIVFNEKNVNTPTMDIAKSTVKLILIFSFFCFD